MAVLVFAEGVLKFFKRWIFPILIFIILGIAVIIVVVGIIHLLCNIVETIETKTGKRPSDNLFSLILTIIVLVVIPWGAYLLVELLR